MENHEQEVRQDREDLIEGRNAVAEAIRAGRTIDKIFVARGDTDRTLARILARARENGIVVTECDRRKLDSLSATGAHQGVIAQAAMREYASIEDILERAAGRGEDPFIVVCDEIADPHNLGAILRTAECAGVHGVIIPKRRAAGLTAVVDKASAGAAEHMLVARVTNIPSTLGELKKKGLWVYGTRRSVADENDWARRARHRVGGLRHGAARFGAVRLHREHPPARQDHIAQRLCGGGDPHV